MLSEEELVRVQVMASNNPRNYSHEDLHWALMKAVNEMNRLRAELSRLREIDLKKSVDLSDFERGLKP